MNRCEHIRNRFLEAYYDELETPERDSLFRHLRECSECRTQYAEMSAALDGLKKYTRPEPDAHFWEGYWHRLAPRLSEDVPAHALFGGSIKAKILSLIDRPLGVRRLAVLVAASVFIGFLASRVFFHGNVLPPTGIADSSSMDDNELLKRTELFMSKAEVIFLSVANRDVENEKDNAAFGMERKYAHALSEESNDLRGRLKAGRHYQMEELVSDLQFILMQIANLEDTYNPEEIRLIQSGIRRKSLLFKLNIEAMEIEEREFKNSGNAPEENII